MSAADITFFRRAGITVVELRGGGRVAFGRSGSIQVPLARIIRCRHRQHPVEEHKPMILQGLGH
jgi:hypothetical protein